VSKDSSSSHTQSLRNVIQIPSRMMSGIINLDDIELKNPRSSGIVMNKKSTFKVEDKFTRLSKMQKLLQAKVMNQHRTEQTVPEILIVDDMLFNIEAIKILLKNCRKGLINNFE
jgi:hypothetical protein